ncbi:hypothetical protein [Hyphomicrobium denitrificans]|uniref:hypothetical protein n=1 Tax=Hyphomicrobium denitrificans TaxID=53399 RepID=UPI00030DFD1A|nr:hypothetical protein [Hyphomicrobium denitrificans]
MAKPKSSDSKSSAQQQKFLNAARELGCSEDDEAFETALKKVASARVQKPSNKPKKKPSAS